MEYSEYMETLKEQIQNKHARQLVAEEIEGHILEQAKDYEEEGMNHEEALKEAVRQMGDPVETGGRLNKIHRPVFPWKMMWMALLLTVISVGMSVVVAQESGRQAAGMDYLGELLAVHGVEFVIIAAILFVDYTAFMRHIRGFYIGYLVLLLFCGISMNFGLDYHTGYLLSYGSQALLPLFFAGMIYQNRGKEVKGIVKSMLWMIVPSFLLLFLGSGQLCMAVILENAFICVILLLFSVKHGIFGERKGRQIFALAGMAAAAGMLMAAMFFRAMPYWRSRIAAMLNPASTEAGYQNLLIRSEMSDFKFIGGNSLLPIAQQEDMVETYLLNSIFSYFGVLAGLVVLAVFVCFLCHAFRQSLHQRNRMGFLLGIACSSGLLVRVAAYIAINFGYAFWYTTAVPFFGGNLIDVLVNGIYVGLLFSVLRNKMILGETQAAGKENKIHLPA